MILKGIIDEDFVNYKKPSMVLLMPYCNWKCGAEECHNSPMATAPEIGITPGKIVKRYLDNPITEAIVFSGLEPLMSFDDVLNIVKELRKYSNDIVVIYTGYNKDEIPTELKELEPYGNIIMKFGRYIPGQMSRKDPLLGVILVSENQYAEQIS